MATLGESVGGLLGQFNFIFIFLLVFAIVYGALAYINPLKDEKRGIYAIIGFVIAILVSASTGAVTVIKTMTVWFFVLGLLGFLLLFVIGIFGLKEKNFIELIQNKDVNTWVIIFAIVIILFALGSAFGESLLKKGDWEGNGEAVEAQPETMTAEEVVTADQYVSGETQPQSAGFADNVLRTIVNPNVMGLILVMFIALFAVIFLSKPVGT